MQDREQMLENARLICDLQHYLIGKMKAREEHPAEDMISDIVHAKMPNADGTTDVLTFPEAVSLIRAMLIAGNDTTVFNDLFENAIGDALHFQHVRWIMRIQEWPQMQMAMRSVGKESAGNSVRFENILHFHQEFRQSIRWDRNVFDKRKRS